MILYLGYDPGTNGALVAMTHNRSFLMIHRTDDEDELLRVLRDYSKHQVFCLAERVQASIERDESGQAKQAWGAASVGKFMNGFGFVRGVLAALEIPTKYVMPQHWQAEFVESRKKAKRTKTQHKAALKEKAQEIFPDVKVTLRNSDALLLAYLACGKPERSTDQLTLGLPVEAVPPSL